MRLASLGGTPGSPTRVVYTTCPRPRASTPPATGSPVTRSVVSPSRSIAVSVPRNACATYTVPSAPIARPNGPAKPSATCLISTAAAGDAGEVASPTATTPTAMMRAERRRCIAPLNGPDGVSGQQASTARPDPERPPRPEALLGLGPRPKRQRSWILSRPGGGPGVRQRGLRSGPEAVHRFYMFYMEERDGGTRPASFVPFVRFGPGGTNPYGGPIVGTRKTGSMWPGAYAETARIAVQRRPRGDRGTTVD